MLNRVLWPERMPVTHTERAAAAARITHARQRGLLTEEQAQQRHAKLPAATTREDLRSVLDGLPGVASARLFVARRVVTAVWLAATATQLLLWVVVSVVTRRVFDPWWLPTTVGGGLVIGWLSWATASTYRARGSTQTETGIEREGHETR